jgi:hypothetical protein
VILANAMSALTPLLLVLVGSGGFIGALVGFAKLGSEKASAAMGQAQGANEVLKDTLDALERDRDYWKALYMECARARQTREDT